MGASHEFHGMTALLTAFAMGNILKMGSRRINYLKYILTYISPSSVDHCDSASVAAMGNAARAGSEEALWLLY